MNLFGGDDEVENFFSGNRIDNQIKFTSKAGVNATDVERLTWEPAFGSWHLVNSRETNGKTPETYLDLNATKSSTK